MTFSIFPYVGGKSELAPWIVEQLPRHSCYVEPFAGSASVLLVKPRSKVEVLNDLDADVAHFFKVVRDRADELREFCYNVPYSRQLYNEWADDYYAGERPDDPVERAGRWLFLRYAAFGGKYGRKSGFKRASHLNKQPPSKIWAKVPTRIEDCRDRLRGVEIECLNAHDIIERYDGPETVFYCDPPYLECKPDYYATGAFDHDSFEAALSQLEGFAIVSYGELPKAYENGWYIYEQDYTQRARRGATGEWNEDATERLCLNYDPVDTPRFSTTEQTVLTGGDRE